MILRLLLVTCMFLPLDAAAERFRNVGAAVATRSFSVDMDFEDGESGERRFRRAGVEYWEGLTDHVSIGVSIGYAEDEGRDPARPFETVSGNYGALGLRFDAPVTERVFIKGRVEYLLQRTRQDTVSSEFETRSHEARAEIGPWLRYTQFEIGIGASWRDIDYRETLHGSDSDTVRHAEAPRNTGAFASLGLRTDRRSGISLRYDLGAEAGWALRFERTF